MKKLTGRLSLVWAALALVAPAQVSVTFGPQPVAPQGCQVCGTISNDTQSTIIVQPCPLIVKTLAGAIVWTHDPGSFPCTLGPQQIQPGGIWVSVWDQTNNQGFQVPLGPYIMELTDPAVGPNPVTTVVQVVSNQQSAISALGASTIGTSRPLVICSPSSPNLPYLMAVSRTHTQGIPLCPPIVSVPLDVDWLFLLSIQPGMPFFANFTGTLDSTGQTVQGIDPALVIPNNPLLIGLQIHVAAVTFNQFAPTCPFRTTEPFSITIQ